MVEFSEDIIEEILRQLLNLFNIPRIAAMESDVDRKQIS